MKVLRSFEGRSRLATFLVVVARRTALRTLADLRPQVSGRAVATEPLDPAPDPAERAEREEARALVRESIGTLGERDALAIRLFYEQNLSHREIGAALGVPVTHVGQILSRAREKLRARLDRKGLGLEHVDGVS
jgi:RNA polymerase sigma factor (sigma-70 family)